MGNCQLGEVPVGGSASWGRFFLFCLLDNNLLTITHNHFNTQFESIKRQRTHKNKICFSYKNQKSKLNFWETFVSVRYWSKNKYKNICNVKSFPESIIFNKNETSWGQLGTKVIISYYSYNSFDVFQINLIEDVAACYI